MECQINDTAYCMWVLMVLTEPQLDSGFIITHLCSFVSKVVFVSICKNFWDCGLVAIDDITVSVGDCQITAGNGLSET